MRPVEAIRSLDMQLIDDLFQMSSGYVLDFSDRTFASFFADELGVRIDDPTFRAEGTSKARRLRYFLRSATPSLRVKTLIALWEYRKAALRRSRIVESMPGSEDEFWALVVRLGGNRPESKTGVPDSKARGTIDLSQSHALRDEHLALSRLAPQPRGFAFEKFLKRLFDANGLAPRDSFRLVGEQIDGSFLLGLETYLLEAKWQGPPVGVGDLLTFNGKLDEKAAWSRGLFVSESGFSPDGLVAFGRAKRVVCMDGLDLHEMLDRGLTFSDVMAAKVRRAAESGSPYVPLRELNL
jgi:hypothetical protein